MHLLNNNKSVKTFKGLPDQAKRGAARVFGKLQDAYVAEDDFFKHHADKLNKQADAGNSAMVDTEYHGAIAIDYVDRADRRIIGSDEDGESVELEKDPLNGIFAESASVKASAIGYSN